MNEQKRGIGIDANKLRNLNVADKFKLIFGSLQKRFLIVILLVLILGIGSCYEINNIYKTYYMQNKWQGEIRADIQTICKAFLWAYSSDDDPSKRQEMLDSATKTAGDLKDEINELSLIYNGKQDIGVLASDIDKLNEYSNTLVSMYLGGSTKEEINDYFNNTLYSKILNIVDEMKLVREESQSSAGLQYTIAIIGSVFAAVITVIVALLTFLFMNDASQKLSKAILDPVSELSNAASSMAKGELELEINYQSEDELGVLANDLNQLTSVTKDIVNDIRESLDRMASGDFSTGSNNPSLYIGAYRSIADDMEDISSKLSSTLREVKYSSTQVSQGATNMSQGSSALAEGATDQAAAVEELTASVNTVTEQTRQMAETADASREMAIMVKESSENSANKMKLVTDSMERITTASQEINEITNTIESIAKQTALLALNASIEAARAGEAGRGFAVVADEISTLAMQSSEAANNTKNLINDTLDEIMNGNTVVSETTEALKQVQDAIMNITEMIAQTGEMAIHQASSMEEINDGIEQISTVIQNNSATAQQSSAVSQELSDQSDTLNSLIERFTIQ